MNKGTSGMMKGIGAGMIAGMVVGIMGSQMAKNEKQVKKKACKAIDAVGDFIENAQYMFK